MSAENHYRRLRQQARHMAEVLNEKLPETSIPELNYIRTQAKGLLSSIKADELTPIDPACAAEQILGWMTDKLPSLFAQDVALPAIRLQLMRDLGLDIWERLMTEAPMGDYATFAARTVRTRGWLKGKVLELGAGVGAFSQLIHKDCTLTRSDRLPAFLDKRWSQDEFLYDFSQPYAGERRFDVTVAVNALHCVSNRMEALKHCRQTLEPGGRLIICEGQDRVTANEPWALNTLFFPFEGWLSGGGFAQPAQWQSHLQAAGFKHIETIPFTAGPFQLGAVLTGINS